MGGGSIRAMLAAARVPEGSEAHKYHKPNRGCREGNERVPQREPRNVFKTTRARSEPRALAGQKKLASSKEGLYLNGKFPLNLNELRSLIDPEIPLAYSTLF